MHDDALLRNNPGIEDSARILEKYFEKGVAIRPDLSTDSMQRELDASVEDLREILRAEEACQFPTVRDRFRVIDDDTVLVIADENMKNAIRYGGCDWRDIQRKAVSVRKYYVDELKLKPLKRGIYDWNLEYDGFLGIMKGVLERHRVLTGILIH